MKSSLTSAKVVKLVHIDFVFDASGRKGNTAGTSTGSNSNSNGNNNNDGSSILILPSDVTTTMTPTGGGFISNANVGDTLGFDC